MSKNYKIIVAHPDDEAIFFSSIAKSASEIIFCFNKTKDNIVSLGREKVKKKLPLKNNSFLDLTEADVFNTADWKNPEDSLEGIKIKKNREKYHKNFLALKYHLSKKINEGDTIYTHNPWGEYGHEDHIQVFKAVKDLKKKFKLKIFMNGYVSNKSYNLMQKKQVLISNKIQYKIVNSNFTNKLKKIYMSNNCWTFDDNYIWPKIEVFFQISNVNNKFSLNKKNTSSPPLNFMNDNYKVNIFKKVLEKLISYKLKKKIKNFLHKY